MIHLHFLISMNPPRPQRRPHMRKINLDLLLRPPHNRGKQIQTPPFNTLLPINPVILPQLLEPLIRRPATNRQLPAMLNNVYKARGFYPRALFVGCAQRLSEAVAEFEGELAPAVVDGAGGYGAVVGFGDDGEFELFDVAAGLEVAWGRG